MKAFCRGEAAQIQSEIILIYCNARAHIYNIRENINKKFKNSIDI